MRAPTEKKKESAPSDKQPNKIPLTNELFIIDLGGRKSGAPNEKLKKSL